MSELSQDAKSLIVATQHGDDPLPADEARVHGALMVKLGVGVLAGGVAAAAGQQAAVSAAAKASVASAVLGSVGFKIAAVAVIGSAVFAGGAFLIGRDPTPRSPVDAEPAPAAALAASAPGEQPSPAPDRPVSVDELPIAAAAESAKSTAPAASRKSSTLGAEVAAVEEANRALRAGDPERAMRVLEGNARLLEDGALKEESAVARILALCEMGKQNEAAAEARRFLQVAPRSPLVGRVRASCAFAPSTDPSSAGTPHRNRTRLPGD